MKPISAAICVVLFLLANELTASPVEVRVHPGDYVYVYEMEPARDVYSAMVHQIAVLNSSDEPFELQSIELQALKNGTPVSTILVEAEDLETSAKKVAALDQQGVLKMYDFHFQTSRYLPENVKFSATRTLDPGQAILVFSKVLVLSGKTEEIAVLAHGKTTGGKPIHARCALKVRKYTSTNEYHFPLTGAWYVGAGPSLQSHHRWVANQEFALDLIATGAGGKTHEGNGAKLSQYYAYGKEVMAIGDGEVVDTFAEATESDSNLKQPEESWKDYDQRVLAMQGELLAKSYRGPLGNYVVIKHAGGEYSHYAHLQTGSVLVKKGDVVKRGQAIGKLGHSGNSTEPHLHFQVGDGMDPMYSRAIPVKFTNVEVEGLGMEDRFPQTGWFLNTK